MKPAYRELPTDWLTVAEAALTLQVTSQAVYRALGAGRLPFRMIEGRKCVKREGLTAAYWGTSQRRDPRAVQASVQALDEISYDDLARHTDQVMAGLDAAPSVHWQRIAELVNGFLGPDWPAPPWTAEQVNTLEMCLALAHDTAGDD